MLRYSYTIAPRLRLVRYNSTIYNNVIGTLKKDLKEGMSTKDALKKTAIKSILSTIKNNEIDAKDKSLLDEYSLHDAFTKMVAQRNDSIKEFIANKRDDLAEKEKQEIEVINKYLKELPVSSAEDLKTKATEYLKQLQESEPNLQLKQLFGKVDWDALTKDWKASQKSIRTTIVSEFKNIFKS